MIGLRNCRSDAGAEHRCYQPSQAGVLVGQPVSLYFSNSMTRVDLPVGPAEGRLRGITVGFANDRQGSVQVTWDSYRSESEDRLTNRISSGQWKLARWEGSHDCVRVPNWEC